MTIYVKDIDNNFPNFMQDPVPETIGDDTPIGEVVAVLPVRDEDAAYRDSVQFSITGGNDEGVFDIYSDAYTLQGLVVVSKVSHNCSFQDCRLSQICQKLSFINYITARSTHILSLD